MLAFTPTIAVQTSSPHRTTSSRSFMPHTFRTTIRAATRTRTRSRRITPQNSSTSTPRARPASQPQATTKPTETPSTPSNSVLPPLHDVLVIGAGPAGLSLAAALGAQNLSVSCVDAKLGQAWPNHYGVWRDEFTRAGIHDCATSSYPTTVVHAGAQPGDELKLDRGYVRVDRVALKQRLVDECKRTGVKFVERFVASVTHDNSQWSVVTFAEPKNIPSDEAVQSTTSDEVDAVPDALRARLVVDCTGHAVAFTDVEPTKLAPRMWYQAAYGIEAEVKSYPFAKDEMVLMDFRDNHMQTAEQREASEKRPTFLYVFPSGERQAFFEETSVIQKQALSFEELKERLYERLRHDGIEVTRVIEEELSFIPLGGALPIVGQRVVAFGGAALLVHPATGYMVGRTVRMAQQLASTVKESMQTIGETGDVTQVSKACWDEVWGLHTRRQRDFLIFGAELLESLNMEESRAFFLAFFKLPEDLWSRFLGYELDSPLLRAQFALTFFFVADNQIRIRLLRAMVEIGGWRMVRSVLPEWMTAHED